MVKQYVGARYVPKLASPVEWASNTSYEALTIVTFNNASYTSKVPVPPTVGNPANNPQYWALTGNYNAQVEQYRQETETVSNNLTTEITNRKNADTTLKVQITTEITNREKADTTLQGQITTVSNNLTTLQGNINSEVSTRALADSNLQSQINQIIAPSGEAPSAAEVQNARIGADGVTYDTLGESIRENDNELKQMINIPDEDMEVKEYLYWNRLNSGASDASVYATNYLYEPGYIKKAHVKIIGDTDQTGALYAYTKNGNGYDLWGKLCDFTGHGEIVVTVNKNIDKKFILAFSCNKLAYKTGVTSKYNSAFFSEPHSTISDASFSSNLSFAVGVIYDRFIDAVNEIQTVKIIPDYNTRYPIVWDFENSELKVNFYVIKPKNRFLSTRFKGSYSISITQGTYKSLFLVYDENADSLEVVEAVSLLPTNLMNKYVVAGIQGDGLRFTICSINAEMVKVINKSTVDKETFPLYAKRRIYTLPIMENKWFNCDGVFLGDSLTLGLNPDDNYNAMLNDNISAIAKEELGLYQGYNYGIGGTLISGSSSESFINRYSNMFDYSNVNLVCVWGGTNDFYHGVDLGSMSDVRDNTKFIPALYNLIDGLLKKYKNNKAQIVVISPPHLYGSEDGYKEDIPRNGYVLKDLVDAMDDVCNYFGVPFCNLYKTIGFTPRISDVKTLYQPDGVHFNVNGNRQYACNRIVNFIKSEL